MNRREVLNKLNNFLNETISDKEIYQWALNAVMQDDFQKHEGVYE